MTRVLESFKRLFIIAITLLGMGLPNSLFPQSWSPTVDVSVPAMFQDANSVQITVNSSGRFVAIWEMDDALFIKIIQASTSTDGINWSTPFDVSLNGSALIRSSFNPQITADPSGLFVATWEQLENLPAMTKTIQTATSMDGLNWTTPIPISSALRTSGDPQIAVDSTGRFVVVWGEFDGVNDYINSSTSIDGTTWSIPAMVSGLEIIVSEPQIAVDGSGNFVSVWKNDDDIEASMTSNGTIWSAPATISPPLQVSAGPQIAASAGRFVIVWKRDEALNFEILASTSTDGTTWTGPTDIFLSGPVFIAVPQIAVNSTGQFVTIWGIGAGIRDIETSTSSDGVTWTAPVQISDPGSDNSNSNIAGDSLGGFIAVWSTDIMGNNSIQSSTSTNGTVWTAPSQVSDVTTNTPDTPQVVASGTGYFVTVWDIFDNLTTSNIIQAAASTLAALEPPTSASGQRIANRFLTQTNLVNQLRWTASPSANVTMYKIYRNGTLIATVSSSTFTYTDSRGSNSASVTYEITAINALGDESLPIPFTVN